MMMTLDLRGALAESRDCLAEGCPLDLVQPGY